MAHTDMKTIVIVTHPNIELSNWNQAWLNELRQHEDITVHELYKEHPDENIDVTREQRLIEDHDFFHIYTLLNLYAIILFVVTIILLRGK